MKSLKSTVLLLIITFFCMPIITPQVFAQFAPVTDNGQVMKVWGFLPDPVFQINGKEFSRKDLLNFVSTRLKPEQMQYITEKNAKKLAPRLITDCIDNELLVQCAAKDGIKPSPKLIIDDMDKDFKAMNEQQQQQLSEALFKKFKMNFDQYKKKISSEKNIQQQSALNLWMKKYVKPSIKVTEAEVKKFYDESADMIDASHIVIKPKAYTKEAEAEAKKIAESILARLKKGEKFEDLAKESSCSNPNLGEFPRGKMVQEFDDAAFKLKPGEYSSVVKSPFGYHVIRVNKKRKMELPPLKDLEKQIREQLSQMKTQNALIAKVQSAKVKAKIVNYYKPEAPTK